MANLREFLFDIYLIILTLCVFIGVLSYRLFDRETKLIFYLILLSFVSEFLTKLVEKEIIYHFIALFYIIIITLYFLYTVKSKHKKQLFVANAVLWVFFEIINCVFFEPLTELNSNILSLISFVIILQSLFALYKILSDDSIVKLFSYVHFWFWTFFLLLWSCTFFFWAYIKILNKTGWIYLDTVLILQICLNIIVYLSMGFVLFFYPKKSEE